LPFASRNKKNKRIFNQRDCGKSYLGVFGQAWMLQSA
jgi:hypothetical protein